MHRKIPRVEGGWLFQSETESEPILVGSPAWYDWLEHHSAFVFYDRVGGFVAHKRSTDPSDLYWEATSTQAGKHETMRLGDAHTLTLERLQSAAHALVGEHPPTEAADESSTQSALALHQHQAPHTAASVGPLRSLVRTKLNQPRRRSDMIPRARLLERLNAGQGGNVTLVCAPAGFGKTTLLAQWVQTLDRPVAWLSLDEYDNELRTFVRSLTAAMQSVFPDALEATFSLCNAPRFPAPDYVATLLINELADVPEDVVLVLDDFHLIHESEVHTLIKLLIEHLPLQLHLVLATRSDPPLQLARWRVGGNLHELRHTDLRFTLEETEAYLTRMLGSDAAHEVAMALEEQTEGWIAVLQLAALSLRNTSDQTAFMERLRHTPDHSMSSYLLEEVLSQLTPDLQLFLERTSLLDQFCAELCVATIGMEDSHTQVQATLDWLEHSNFFLVPLDERQGWYRFHHLFRQLLQRQLQTDSSEEERVMLHRRASAWYAGQGLLEEAIEHALAAGDAREAAQLVEAQFLPAFEQEQSVQMEHWLRLLPEEQIQVSPWLLIVKVWIVQTHGQFKPNPGLLTAAEQLVASSKRGASDLDDSQSRIQHALIAMGWSQFQYFAGQMQASLESARSALERLPHSETYIANFIIFFLSLSYQATGQEDDAHNALNKALREPEVHLNGTARLLCAQALVYLAAGKLHQVEHTARHLLRLSQEADLPLSEHWAHWLLGSASYEQNNLDTAVYHFSVVIANRHRAHFLVVLDALCGLALAYQAQGLDTQTQETTRFQLEWAQEQHNMIELMTAYAFRGHLALLRNELEEAAQWLEMAGVQEVLGSMTFLEDPPVTRARLLLAKGDKVSLAQGQALLEDLLQHVEAIHSTRKIIKVLALQAWAYDLQERETEALEALERALVLARPGGFLRTFADIPPLARVLGELRKRRKGQKALDNTLDAYLQRVLAAMSPLASAPVSTRQLMRQEGLEPLTERELHILHLLGKDLTNREIARELVVTPGTIKAHTISIYRKLSVNNRHAAVSLAKAIGLLTAP